MTASANPPYRLAPRTSAQQCAPSMRNSFKTTFNAIPKRLHYTRLMLLLNSSHYHRRPWKSAKAFTGSRNRIQSP